GADDPPAGIPPGLLVEDAIAPALDRVLPALRLEGGRVRARDRRQADRVERASHRVVAVGPRDRSVATRARLVPHVPHTGADVGVRGTRSQRLPRGRFRRTDPGTQPRWPPDETGRRQDQRREDPSNDPPAPSATPPPLRIESLRIGHRPPPKSE